MTPQKIIAYFNEATLEEADLVLNIAKSALFERKKAKAEIRARFAKKVVAKKRVRKAKSVAETYGEDLPPAATELTN